MIFLLIPAIAAVGGFINSLTAVERINSANARRDGRQRDYDGMLQWCRDRSDAAQGAFAELGAARMEAVKALAGAARLLGRAKVKERDLEERCQLVPGKIDTWVDAEIRLEEYAAAAGAAVLTGLGTSAAIYGAVGSLAAAGTGTAISSLSGVAATNATLAWLGGGTLAAGGGGIAVGTLALGGLLAGPAVLVGSFFLHGKAEHFESQVQQAISAWDVDEAEKRTKVACLDAANHRAGELTRTTIELTSTLKSEIAEGSVVDDEHAYRIARLAVALGMVIEVRVFEGEAQ